MGKTYRLEDVNIIILSELFLNQAITVLIYHSVKTVRILYLLTSVLFLERKLFDSNFFSEIQTG